MDAIALSCSPGAGQLEGKTPSASTAGDDSKAHTVPQEVSSSASDKKRKLIGSHSSRKVDSVDCCPTDKKPRAEGGAGGRGTIYTSAVPARQLPVVADMMGGVGPFAVPLSKTQTCRVYCNGEWGRSVSLW